MSLVPHSRLFWDLPISVSPPLTWTSWVSSPPSWAASLHLHPFLLLSVSPSSLAWSSRTPRRAAFRPSGKAAKASPLEKSSALSFHPCWKPWARGKAPGPLLLLSPASLSPGDPRRKPPTGGTQPLRWQLLCTGGGNGGTSSEGVKREAEREAGEPSRAQSEAGREAERACWKETRGEGSPCGAVSLRNP